MPLSESNKRKLSAARTGMKNRISKHNKLAADLLGAPPAGFIEDEASGFTAGVRLIDLTKANEWNTPTQRTAGDSENRSPEYLVVDLPSSRKMPIASADLARAGAYEIVLREAWLAYLLHEICLNLVVQVEIFRRTIKRTPGAGPMTQREKAKSATNMREQYHSVRVSAQLFNVFRDRMNRIKPAPAFLKSHPEYGQRQQVARSRFKPLAADDIRCDTKAYDAHGSGNFALPWFWKMTSRTQDISDESFVQDCEGRSLLRYSQLLTSHSLSSTMAQCASRC